MVVIFLPAAAETGNEQERTGSPFTMHGAGAALRDAAAELGALQVEHVAQHPQQRHLGLDVDLRASFR